MQLNTLNRVIALSLIGGFVVVMTAAAREADIRALLEPYSKMGLGAPAGVFLAVALLSLTALAGTVVDALGNVTIRRVITKWIAKKRARAFYFCCADEFDEQYRWRQAFKAALVDSPRYKSLARKDMIKATSAAIFFRTADKEHTEWLIQHHSMYNLSANLVIILLASAGWAYYEQEYYLAVASVAGSYLLTTFALDNYLYAYQLTFRNAFLALNESQPSAPATTRQEVPISTPQLSLDDQSPVVASNA